MNPKQFLTLGGVILVVVGVLGFIGIIGPTSGSSVFGSSWWFDNAENWAHLILGVVALLLLAAPASLQKPIVLVLGVVALLTGLYSAFVGSSFLGANLENPTDTVLHLAIGVWALLASRKKMVGEGGM